MLLVFILDSTWLASHIEYGQWLANTITLAYFIWLYIHSKQRRIQRNMIYAVVIGVLGEIFVCLMLGMYEYRLNNVPLYVPLGHAILYTTVWYLTHDPWVIKQQSILMRVLLGFALSYTLLLLFIDNDIYGAICTVLLLLLLALNQKSRRFFLIMFLAVAYLEQIGTLFECWYWPPTLLDRAGWVSSGNPPSGISLGYFFLDILCLGIYLVHHYKVGNRWRKSLINKGIQSA